MNKNIFNILSSQRGFNFPLLKNIYSPPYIPFRLTYGEDLISEEIEKEEEIEVKEEDIIEKFH